MKPASVFESPRDVRTKEKSPTEKLNGNHSKNELKQKENDQNIEDILDWADDRLEDCLRYGTFRSRVDK